MGMLIYKLLIISLSFILNKYDSKTKWVKVINPLEHNNNKLPRFAKNNKNKAGYETFKVPGNFSPLFDPIHKVHWSKVKAFKQMQNKHKVTQLKGFRPFDKKIKSLKKKNKIVKLRKLMTYMFLQREMNVRKLKNNNKEHGRMMQKSTHKKTNKISSLKNTKSNINSKSHNKSNLKNTKSHKKSKNRRKMGFDMQNIFDHDMKRFKVHRHSAKQMKHARKNAQSLKTQSKSNKKGVKGFRKIKTDHNKKKRIYNKKKNHRGHKV